MKKFICNPLNLNYRYHAKSIAAGDVVFREGADPTMTLFKGVYYLFASVSGGFWYSEDLFEWKFKETPELPYYDYAPDVLEVNGMMIFSASKMHEPSEFYASADPINETFDVIAAPFPFWDPALFKDDDGRLYFYWGCSNHLPLYGIELEADTFAPVGEKRNVLKEQEALHGWERNGDDNLAEAVAGIGTQPYIEGAFMSKHNGKYYLQYAAPGTEWNVYCDGVYVGDSPLGPFEYQAHNPFSSKPGGFITGAGHGSTFRDKNGNWWHVSSMRISSSETFERRVGLFPCGFDDDGVMFCNQNFADYPFALPEGLREDIGRIEPEMMLLSYSKRATASSSQPGCGPELGVNEDVRDWWAADAADKEARYEIDLNGIYEIGAVQINFADHRLNAPDNWRDDPLTSEMYKRLLLPYGHSTRYLLEGSADGSEWMILKDARKSEDSLPHDFIYFNEPLRLRYVRLSEISLPLGGVPAISSLRVFGMGGGNAPAAVFEVNAARSADGLDVDLSWETVDGADGYNIRYGIAPNKMYNGWMVYGKNNLRLSFLNHGQKYWICVDAFNENGVTAGMVFTV